MELTCWQADARAVALDKIMAWALEHYAVDRMLVALRLNQVGNRWRYADPQAGEFFQSQFESYILTGFQAAEWPGTKLLGHPGFVYVVKFNEELRKSFFALSHHSLSGNITKTRRCLMMFACLEKVTRIQPWLVALTTLRHG